MAGEDLPMQPSLSEQLTANFYQWEKRGRGWQVWDSPVELEPAFEPFYHGAPVFSPTQVIDDGRKPTLVSSLVEWIFKKSPQSQEGLAYFPYDEFAAPEDFEDDSELREISISLPPTYRVNLEQAEQFLFNLSFCAYPVSFEIIGTAEEIIVKFACRETDVLQVKQQLEAYFPEATVMESSKSLRGILDNDNEKVVIDFGLSQEFMRPLRVVRGFEPDPLTGMVGAMENFQTGEAGIYQVLFQTVRHPWAESILRSVSDGEGKSFFADNPEMLSLAREKVRKPLFAAVIRVAAQSPSETRAWEIARDLGSGLKPLANPLINELIPLSNDEYDDYSHEEDLFLRRSCRGGMLLNSEELVSLLHPPSVSVKAKKLVREIIKSKAAPELVQGHRLVLGKNVHQGKEVTVSLSSEQRLRHMYVIGATGTGKSTFLLNLILQDIEAGCGIAILDPHGDLIDQVMAHIPEERHEDVILVDPADSEYSVGLNILSAHTEAEQNVLSSDLVAVFQRLSTSWGDQMTSVLGNAILAFLESEEGGTLTDLRRFLIEKDFRSSFLKKVKDPEIVYYWQKEFPLLTGGKSLGPILTRLDNFLRPKLIRYMVSQKEGLNFGKILNSRKIFLAKLSQGLIGEENAYLLGTLIVAKLQQAAMGRQSKSSSERENFFLYIDEFQNFITPSMAALLSGARKYSLGLILAHQELRQLWSRDAEVANSVISNPGTRVCFRLGDFDAKKLEEGLSSFEARDLQNLGIGEAICRVERLEHDFNLKTAGPPEVQPELARTRQESIIALSRKNYALSRREVASRLEQEKKWAPEPEPQPRKEKEIIKKPVKPRVKEPVKEKKIHPEIPVLEGKGGQQHRYLQALIKRMAEEKGYRAVIEQPTPDGKGSVDVGLEKEGKRIAVEVSHTTTGEQELGNIEKCLKAGYDKVILCSQERKTLEKVKDLVGQEIKGAERKKVLFHQPEELYFFLEGEGAKGAGTEKRVKGYRVKTQYQPLKEGEKKTRREAVGNVILQAIRRMKS